MKLKVRMIAILVILCSFSFPYIYSMIQDQKTLHQAIAWSSKENVDEIMNKYPVIQSIYHIYYRSDDYASFTPYELSSASSYSESEQKLMKQTAAIFSEQLQKMQAQEVVDKRMLVNVPITYGTLKIAKEEDTEVILSQIHSMNDHKVYDATIDLEQRSNKIISLSFNNPAGSIPNEGDEKKAMLWKYITYLGLQDITDWKYVNDTYESYEARLQVYSNYQLLDENALYSIGACPIGLYRPEQSSGYTINYQRGILY